VLELLESGELAKLKTKWWLEKGKCDKDGSPKKVLTESCQSSSCIHWHVEFLCEF